jgi:hypothetical protein
VCFLHLMLGEQRRGEERRKDKVEKKSEIFITQRL